MFLCVCGLKVIAAVVTFLSGTRLDRNLAASHGRGQNRWDAPIVAKVLAANLRNISNTAPSISGSSLVNGVYVSSADGSTIAGAGIYVQGDASDVQLYADTNGDQVYVIKQGSTTTTVRTSYANATTTLSSGTTTRSYSGVFTDKSDPANIQGGALLFVNGSITSLRGGKNGSTVRPAIASSTRLTITSNRHITVTGDIKYANPVANSDGTDVSNISSIKNVLGIYTDDGYVYLAPNSTYVAGPGLGLEINAAVVTFNAKTSNDGGASKARSHTPRAPRTPATTIAGNWSEAASSQR